MILVTGANGFLGTEVVGQLIGAGLPVRTTGIEVNSSTLDKDYLHADITSLQQLRRVVTGSSVVIHTAGLAHIFNPDLNSAEKFHQINEIGTANVAAAAAEAGVRHLILISSVSVYGPYTQGMYDEKTPCSPVGSYALSKYNAEVRAIEIARNAGMALTILRFATLYGEGDPGNLGRLMRALDRRRFLWIGDGSNRKSLLYKGDAARACLAVAERSATGINIYNVSGPPCTMREVVDGIADALGKHHFPLQIPASLALFLSRQLSRIPNIRLSGLHQTIKKWLAEDVYDTRRFEEAYGFQTRTSLKDGLKQEVDWYRQKN